MTRDEILNRLNSLLPAQFEELIFRLNVPTHYMSHGTPQASRAIELFRYLDGEGRISDLERLLSKGGGGAPSPRQAPAGAAGPGQTASAKPQVFISYSHHDAAWLQRLQVHLKPLERQGHVELWDDSRIEPGMIWRDEIEKALSQARIAILLISADFLASDFIQKNELPPLLKRAASRGVTILSVIVGPCLLKAHPELSKYQAVNPPSRPLSTMRKSEAEEVMVRLAETILKTMS